LLKSSAAALLTLAVISLFAGPCPTALGATAESAGEAWSGVVDIEGTKRVEAGQSLIIAPGTQVRFAKDAVLMVSGRLVARGTTASPIIFKPQKGEETGSWQGLLVDGSHVGAELENVRIERAQTGVWIANSKVSLQTVQIAWATRGVATQGSSRFKLEKVDISDITEIGIDIAPGGEGAIVGCRLARVGGFGIQVGKKALAQLTGNTVKGAKIGFALLGGLPPVESNAVEECEVGIGIAQADGDTIISKNKITRCKLGIACRQFASPTLEKNVIEECDHGIDCFQASSPVIRHNRLTKNRHALWLVQMCNPEIRYNDFVDNDVAAHLHLSSYGRFHENNFERNRLHIELDNMSYDWEVRAQKKPTRTRKAQLEAQNLKGRSEHLNVRDEVSSDGFVDARGNYWGPETTAEMTNKGPEANISSLYDGFDKPTLTYEGWPGAYKVDRIHYDSWTKERIPDTGP